MGKPFQFMECVNMPPVTCDAFNSGLRVCRVRRDRIDHRFLELNAVPPTLDEVPSPQSQPSPLVGRWHRVDSQTQGCEGIAEGEAHRHAPAVPHLPAGRSDRGRGGTSRRGERGRVNASRGPIYLFPLYGAGTRAAKFRLPRPCALLVLAPVGCYTTDQ